MVLNKRDLERAFSPKFKHKKTIRNLSETVGMKTNCSPPSNIKVFVRVRPLSEREQTQNKRSTIKVIDDKMLVFDPKEEAEGFFFHGVKQKSRDIAKRPNKEMQFIFDRVFGTECTNLEVYGGTTKGIISTLLEGYNCSVFVYGATGAGKTHTMLGNKDNPGITCLTMNELFHQIDEMKSTKNIEIGITYLEVYNENVHDLINPCGPMHLRDDSNGGVLVAGMKVEKISSPDRLFQLLHQGNLNRTQHPTDANAESSRSHAVFQVYVKIQTKASGDVKFGKLSMIDLAGSERGSATGCVGARFKEGSNINKSLLALGNCINNLADGLRHIPYRDSKLTRILKDSLGGNCQTVMIANVSPAILSYEDTYNTLKYATRAKSIKTQLTKNVMSVNLRVEHYVKMCDELRKENAALKEQIKIMNQKQSAVSPVRADPSYVEKLNNLYREKKQLHTEWLNLEAQLKLLQWRIRWKTLAANKLKNQVSQYGSDYNQEFEKDEKSLSQLEARANSIVEKMTELWKCKAKHNEEYNKFTEEMEDAKVTKLLQTEAKLKEAQCENAELLIQKAHHQKIINMQEKRLEDQLSAIDFVTKICSDYHMILRGRNLITDSMNNEYQVGVMKIKGSKAVTWMDMEDGSDDEEGIALSSVSVRPFTNLSLANLNSFSLPIVIPEVKSKTDNVPVSHSITKPEGIPMVTPVPEQTDQELNGTFVLDSTGTRAGTEPPNSTNPTTNMKSSFKSISRVSKRPAMGSTVPLRRRTPAKVKAVGGNKENNGLKITIDPTFLCPTPVRHKTALFSRHVNIQETKTTDSKAPLTDCKMSREKEKKHLNQTYIRPIKLKRLGSTPQPDKTPRKIARI